MNTGIVNLDDNGKCVLEMHAGNIEQFANETAVLIRFIKNIFGHGDRIQISQLRIV